MRQALVQDTLTWAGRPKEGRHRSTSPVPLAPRQSRGANPRQNGRPAQSYFLACPEDGTLPTKTLLALLPLLSVGCVKASRVAVGGPDAAVVGCWEVAPAIFSLRASRPDGSRPTRDTLELRIVGSDTGRSRQLRVFGIKRYAGDPVWQDSAWRRRVPDSLEVIWRRPPNKIELRLRVAADSLHGESFYHGDILMYRGDSGRRAARPFAGARIDCR